MKVKSFEKHLEQRLNKKEIAEIEKAAKIEYEASRALQTDISRAITQYVNKYILKA